jgi:hypothetical protein
VVSEDCRHVWVNGLCIRCKNPQDTQDLWVDGEGPYESPEIPTYMGVMVGWRGWSVSADTGRWASIELEGGDVLRTPLLLSFNSAFWPPGEVMEAECRGRKSNEGHQVPSMSCTCGIYAANSWPHLRDMHYQHYDADRSGTFVVVGAVNLWGNVVEGTQGWRAQFAYPKALYIPFEAYRIAEPLSIAYRVPVKLANTLKKDAELEKVQDPHTQMPRGGG